MMRKFYIVLFSLVVTTVALTTTTFAGANDNFQAHLSGKDAGAETLAQGQAILRFSQDGSEL